MEQRPSRVIVISDFEGISGAHTFRLVIKEFGEPFEKARTLIIEDVNATIGELKAAGSTEIRVVDGHSYSVLQCA